MEYRYAPKQKNRNALYAVTGLGALSVLLLAFGMFNLFALRTVWHFIMLFCLVGTISLFLRYFSVTYVYVVTEEWGEPTLVISEQHGKRLSTRCRLALSHLLHLVEVPDEKSPEGQKALDDYRAEIHRYAFLATLGPTPTQIIYGREGRQRFAIRIEADDAFLEVLRAAVLRADAYRIDEDEEDDYDEE